ncbi:MAG: nickel-dependent lactate racemase [Methanomassiliicoccales archaeon]|nr:nickel-dependent lactate racemase [Methanomassiliicoccales archaeon]
MKVQLPYGSETLTLELPESMTVEILLPKRPRLSCLVAHEIVHALNNPISALPLRSCINHKNKIALICEDITRPTPLNIILPYVLEELQKAGVPRSNVTIFVALGSHRPMTSAEILCKFGIDVCRDYEIRNSPNQPIYIGQTSSGVPIYIDRGVVDADIKIGIGSIFPHPAVGYTGGAKIIYPGVAGVPTVAGLHLIAATLGHDVFGELNNPVRTEIEQWVQKIGLDFIVNVVLTTNNEIYKVVAGHFITAHRAGVKYCKEIYSATARNKADVVIVSSAPADLDFWQAGKAIIAAGKVVRDGGVIILATPCYEGEGPHKSFMELCGKKNLDALLTTMLKNKNLDSEIVLPASVAALLQFVRRKAHIIVVSTGLTREAVEAAGLCYFNDINEAVARVFHQYRNRKNVVCAIIPYGGHTYPMVV